MKVIYEDNHLLAVFKPAGLLTQPSPVENESLEVQAKAWIKDKYQKPGQVFLHAVHRLDRPVSGIVLFAKTSKALSRLNEAIRAKDCEKIYHAEVEGKLPSKEGVLENYLEHSDFEAVEKSSGKLSRLHYKVLANGVVEINLETGRYHQIRAQLSLAGCPIVGDLKYGAKTRFPTGIALTHVRMTITHPITKERLTLS